MHTTKENHIRITGGKHRKPKVLTKQQLAAKLRVDNYNNTPKICEYCQSAKTYKARNNKFCSSSCAAKFNMKIRYESGWRLSAESKNKTSNKNSGVYRGKRGKKEKLLEVIGPYTKIYLCTCKFSGIKFYSKTVRQIYPYLKRNYEDYCRACKFTFGISLYPEWFSYARDLIIQHGWYASSSKTHPGISNPTGVSRDHKISVSYGFNHNIDPTIISHPANCEIMQHKLNSSKKTKCSISLDQLLLDIKAFNNIYHISKDSNLA
jgi:hypothetical protein